MPHDFTWFKIVCLLLAILFLWGIRYGMMITPQIRSTANQIADLNKLQTLDLSGKIGGCIPWNLKGVI
jgi:hypothetical protein